MTDTVILIFDYQKINKKIDIEVPLNITANELIYGLNKGLRLGINTNNMSECYLCTEEPRALLRGDTCLENYGLRNGTIITFRR